MIWPFKKRQPAIPWSEFIETLDEPPCGDRETHYHWTIRAGSFPCPACAADTKIKEEAEKENRLARKIAEQVVALQKERT